MSDSIRILGIVGSLRKKSYNRAALRAAMSLAPQGATVEAFELDGLPGFNEDDEKSPPAQVVELKKHIRAADALLIVTPEYNYSVPGVLKNAIDWASRPYGDSAWAGKPAAIMGASVGGIGTARAQYHLRQMLVFLDVLALNKPEVMIGNAASKFDAEGNLTDDKTKEAIQKQLAALVAWTRRLKSTVK
ncbi:MAG: NADPH-dependent FMN reductase [Planctomycetota bacterium]